MWQVSVYSRRQHEQFRFEGQRFALAKSAVDDCWRPLAGQDGSSDAPTIRLRTSGESLVVACRGLNCGLDLAAGGSFSCEVPTELPVPCVFQLDNSWFEIRREAGDATALGLEPLHARHDSLTSGRHATRRSAGPGPDAATVARWLAVASQLHRIAASSRRFFIAAAELSVQSTGLDTAMVVLRQGDGWQIAGSVVQRPAFGISFNADALQLLLEEPDVWRRPGMPLSPAIVGAEQPAAMALEEFIVLAPVRNDAGEVIAAIYGVRHGRGDNRRRGIRTLEARVIESVADAVAVGLARREQEIEAARQRVLLEQAFSPAVAEYLQRHPEALQGQTREATLLFADLRGFTRLAENLPPADSYELLASVMETLTRAIVDHDGVVIDYYGDGVTALWNAPFDTPDHADRACAAAMQMLGELPAVSEQWQRMLPQPLKLAIGIHAGAVQVGNAGTLQRLKYGPRGRAVNVTSRVQTAAKRLDVEILTTDAVRRRLTSRYVTLKVCTARLPGLEEPLELFTVFPSTDAPALQGDLERYAAALEAFEQGDLEAAEQQLTHLLAKGPATPAAFLAQQTAALRRGALGRRSTDQFGCTPDAVIEILAK